MPPWKQSLTVQAFAQAGRMHEVHGALFEHARAYPVDHVVGAPPLQDDRIQALEMEQVREHQAGGPAPDDDDPSA